MTGLPISVKKKIKSTMLSHVIHRNQINEGNNSYIQHTLKTIHANENKEKMCTIIRCFDFLNQHKKKHD